MISSNGRAKRNSSDRNGSRKSQHSQKGRSAESTLDADSTELKLKQRLARLTLAQAKKLLGANAQKLIAAGAQRELSPQTNVYFRDDLFRLTIPGAGRRAEAIVTITPVEADRGRLHWNCTSCDQPCEHIGAALSMILEEKTALGLIVAPDNPRQFKQPANEQELVSQALAERVKRSEDEQMKIQSNDASRPWVDYKVTSALSGKSYRVALRGPNPGDSFCSCPDFRTNTLGTCKHILHTLTKVRRRLGPRRMAKRYRHDEICVAIKYGHQLELRMFLPEQLDQDTLAIVNGLDQRPIKDVRDLLKCVRLLERNGQRVTIYPDAEEYIQQRLYQQQIADHVAQIRRDPHAHPLRTQLLRTELLPYQLDGIAFAVGAGRAILADEMGLGKTIQGVGVAELLAREAGIKKVLVVCPASLKAQWRNEIERFSGREVQLIGGAVGERSDQYATDAFFTICNYEQVMRDLPAIERSSWDLIVLDEGQRIKNWEAKTTRVIKGLRSRFALVLTGTPLENRLDDLYSIVQFIDDRRLGAGFRFFHRHRIVDEKGRVLGYKDLATLRSTLEPVLLRRTRESVQQQLPPRRDEIIRIAPTPQQQELSNSHLQNVSRIVNKPYLTEMDLLALQRELLFARLAADSTCLVDKQKPGFSSKLERLDELIESLFAEPGRKAVLFSEWTSMLDLIEPLVEKRNLKYVRLDGSVPQKLRQDLVNQFQTDDSCCLFLTTNAGSTGLNLQAANTVINVDLPWNPAVLEQRIARAYRMGQQRPVDVYLLVTEQTLEERMLATLAGKHELALAALDSESDVDQVHLESGMAELKRRLHVLLGAKTAVDDDAGLPAASSDDPRASDQQDKLAVAAGQLFTSAAQFLNQLMPQQPESDLSRQLAATLKQGLSHCIEQDSQGRTKISVPLPDTTVLDQFVESLSRLLVR